MRPTHSTILGGTSYTCWYDIISPPATTTVRSLMSIEFGNQSRDLLRILLAVSD
jgi:hypothetical protein|eukprot:COSAG06_NODE_1236_length_10137_cov_3.357342_10_plen_54_part_00